MSSIYEIVKSVYGNEVIKRTDADGSIWWIPQDDANSDYQKYLKDIQDEFTNG